MPKSIFILSFFLFPLFVTAQTADFTFESSNGIFCNPSTVQFTQNCTGNPIGFVWDFGNGTKGYDETVSVVYSSPGSYSVKLVAIYDEKTIEVSKVVVINPKVTATISFDKNYICQPGVINFSGPAGDIASYAWDFGDSTGIVNAVTPDTGHIYGDYGDYTISLTATNSSGCVGTATTTVRVIKPTIAATATPSTGCIPANVKFNANVTVPVNDFVTSYTWDFGDGSSAPPSTKNPSNSYTATGVYSPKISIVTNEGCTNTFNYPALAFGTPPTNHVAYAKDSVICGSDLAVFVSKATNANRYTWTFGDNTTGLTSDTIITHKYNTLGARRALATPFFNGCPGTPVSFPINVVGVIAKYTYSNTCADKKTYSFNSTSLGNPTSYEWNYNDGSIADITSATRHNFPDTGRFLTTLTVRDAVTACSDTFAQTIYTANPVLENPDASICKNTNTSFSILNSYSDSLATYTWNIAGNKVGPGKDASITIKADTFGLFNNFVSIKYGSQSCLDTIQLNHLILVKGPNIKYDAPTPICLNTVTTITNITAPFVAGDSITLLYWNYGNSPNNDTIYQPLPFQYKRTGNYRVIQTAEDINGCKDSLIKFIKVNSNPFLKVIPRSDTLCLGQPDTLIAFSSSDILWSPPAGLSCTTCDTVRINPATTTQYNIAATTAFGCSIQDSILVTVIQPFTAVSPLGRQFICLGDQVQLSMNPSNKIIVWSPPEGLSSVNIYDPIAKPTQTTTYTATLQDSVGCFTSSANITVVLKTPPTVAAGPDRILQYSAPFSITPAYSSNVRSYLWTPSGTLSCTTCANPNGVALNSQTYTITVTSDSGCVARDLITINIECKDANLLMAKAFTPNNDNLNDYYYPIARGIKTILRFTIFNREGHILYQAKDFPPNDKTFAWDGTYKGKQQSQATYVYVMEALCEVGEKLTKSGSFLLLR